MSNLAKSLRHARSRLGWSQNKLAEESGVSQAQISRIERGQVPGADVLCALADALGVSLDSLVRPPRRRRPRSAA